MVYLYTDMLPLVLGTLVAYFFGSLPIAYRVGRSRGVNIFATGTGLAGTSNVFRNVGKRWALLVFVFDIAKGSLAIVVAYLIGIEGFYIIAPALAVVIGHWNSVFTGFRGGDGFAVYGGIALAIYGLDGLAAMVTATVVSMGGQKLPYPSLVGIGVGYAVLFGLALRNGANMTTIVGVGVLMCIVLMHAMRGHWLRRRVSSADMDHVGPD